MVRLGATSIFWSLYTMPQTSEFSPYRHRASRITHPSNRWVQLSKSLRWESERPGLNPSSTTSDCDLGPKESPLASVALCKMGQGVVLNTMSPWFWLYSLLGDLPFLQCHSGRVDSTPGTRSREMTQVWSVRSIFLAPYYLDQEWLHDLSMTNVGLHLAIAKKQLHGPPSPLLSQFSTLYRSTKLIWS